VAQQQYPPDAVLDRAYYRPTQHGAESRHLTILQRSTETFGCSFGDFGLRNVSVGFSMTAAVALPEHAGATVQQVARAENGRRKNDGHRLEVLS